MGELRLSRVPANTHVHMLSDAHRHMHMCPAPLRALEEGGANWAVPGLPLIVWLPPQPDHKLPTCLLLPRK